MCDGCNTSSATTAANPDAQAAYTDVVGKAQAVAGTPYQPFGGELVAGLNQGQNTAVSQLAGTYGAAQPYIRQGSADMAQAGAGLGNVQQYLQAGSSATANVQPYQAAAADQYGQGNTLTLMGSTANQQVGQYLGLAQGAYGQAQGYAGQAAGAYGQEQAGLGQVGQYLNNANGYFGQAASLATPQDFTGADGVSKYMNPYTQSVIDTTMATARQNDAAQTASVVGNAIGSGAYGGDRNGIAVATLAGQQDQANNATIAGLNQANYAQATQQFNTTQAQRQAGAGIYTNLGQGELQAGGLQLNTAQGYGQAGAGYAGLGQLANQTGAGYAGLGTIQGQVAGEYGALANNSNAVGAGYLAAGQLGLGTAAQYGQLGTLQGTTGQAYGTLGGQLGALGAANQSSLISGASAGLQGATLAQQNAQQQDTAAYNQYMAGLSYPYQNVGFLSNIVQGIGSQEGNTQTTQGNALSSIAGLGTSSIGILGATGAFGANGYLSGLGSAASGLHFAHGGAVRSDRESMNFGLDPRLAAPAPMIAAPPVTDPGLGGLGNVGRFAALQGADLAARMSKAGGGPVMAPADMGAAMMPGLGSPAPAAISMMPGMAGLGLGSRPHFDFGGPVDPNAPTQPAGLNVSPAALTSGAASGLNTSPAALTGGMATAHAAPGLGTRPSILTAAPNAAPSDTTTGSAGLGGSGSSSPAGLGSPISFSGPSQPGSGAISFSDTGSAGGPPSTSGGSGSGPGDLSRNAWMAVLAAGLGMMGGTSASATANIGAGGLKGLQTYLGLEQQDRTNAVQQQDFGLRSRQADQTAAYQQGNLALDNRKEDFAEKRAQQIMDAAMNAQKALSGATDPSRSVAAPGIPTPLPGASSGSAIPPLTQPSSTPAPTPPPQGGVSASGGAPPVGSADFWSKASPDSNPLLMTQQAQRFMDAGRAMAAANPESANQYFSQAQQLQNRARQIYDTGKVMMRDGSVATLPGFNEAAAATTAATEGAKAGVLDQHELVKVADPNGGGEQYVPKSVVTHAAQGGPLPQSGPPGAGSPPGSSAATVAQAAPILASNPKFIEQAQADKAKAEAEMDQQFQARQISRQRLGDLRNIMTKYQTGDLAGAKADAVAFGRAIGMPVSDTATASPEFFQRFGKDATANVFSDVKGQGGRVLVSEIEGLTKANANAEASPAANAAILNQGLGILNYEDQHYKDYVGWRDQNPHAWNASNFEIGWQGKNNVQQYVDQAGKDFAYKGQAIPAPTQRAAGQMYMTPKGPMRWVGNGWSAN